MESNGFKGRETAGQVITCKAAVLWGPREPLVIEEVEVEPPQRMEVRIRILFTSICHSDLGAWKGEHEAHRVYPRILGHEASGIVESVGDGVMDMKAGDHVIPIFTGECGDCRCCKSDKTNLCERFRVDPFKTVMTDGRPRFSLVGADGERRPVYHFINTSTFAEYTVLDSACVVKINEKAPLELMCLLSCGVSTGVGAAWNVAKMEEGSTAAIFGLGAVGLAVAQGARLSGASRIIGVDINPEKAEKGMEMGLTDFIDPSKYTKPVHEVIHEMCEGGVDYSFECAGNLDVFREAFTSTHDGGGLTVLLGIHTNPRLLPLHPMELHGRSILGCDFGGFKGKSQLPGLVDKCIEEGSRINLRGFITHELPFDQINEAFELLKQGKSIRGCASKVHQVFCMKALNNDEVFDAWIGAMVGDLTKAFFFKTGWSSLPPLSLPPPLLLPPSPTTFPLTTTTLHHPLFLTTNTSTPSPPSHPSPSVVIPHTSPP